MLLQVKDRNELADKMIEVEVVQLPKALYLFFFLWIIGLFFSSDLSDIVAIIGCYLCLISGLCMMLFGSLVMNKKLLKDKLVGSNIVIGFIYILFSVLFYALSGIHIL